jgi:hypothetical protein
MFPGKISREALRSVARLEQSLPESLGPQLGFDAIKTRLREHLLRNPDSLEKAVYENANSTDAVVLILARNIAWDELASGNHMTFGTRKTMIGDGLVSLFGFLTSELQRVGVETTEQGREAKANLRQMIEDRFG